MNRMLIFGVILIVMLSLSGTADAHEINDGWGSSSCSSAGSGSHSRLDRGTGKSGKHRLPGKYERNPLDKVKGRGRKACSSRGRAGKGNKKKNAGQRPDEDGKKKKRSGTGQLPGEETTSEVTGKNVKVIVERPDDVPLLVGMMMQTGLHEVIDRHIARHPLQRELSWGLTTVIWLACILSEGDHRKVSVETYIKGMKNTLSNLTGQDISEADFTDDRLTNLLKYLSSDSDWENIEIDLGQRTISAYELKTETVRCDATTVSGYREIKEDGMFQFGHSKDDPSLPQIKIATGSLDPLGMPLATDVVSGERADDLLYESVIKRIDSIIGKKGLLYVGDCKMCAFDTRQYIVGLSGYYFCPLPRTGNTSEDIEEWIREGISREKKDKQAEEKDKRAEEKDKRVEKKDKQAEEKDKQAEKKDKRAEKKDKQAEEKDKQAEEKDKQAEKKDKQAEEKDKQAEKKDKQAEKKKELTEIKVMNDKDEEVIIAKGYELKRERKGVVEGKEMEWTERVLIVKSLSYANKMEKGLETRLKNAEEKIRALTPQRGKGKKQITEEAELKSRAEEILKKHRVEGLLDYEYERETEKKVKYVGRGRGSVNRKTEVIERIRYQITNVTRNGVKIKKEKEKFGWRAYVTNAPEKRLSLSDAVKCYRNQYRIERVFDRLKNCLKISPVFVKREDQIVGMTHLLTLGVRILTLTEFIVRRSLNADNSKLGGLHPENRIKETDKPTAERLLKAFSGITLIIIKEGNKITRLLTPLSELQKNILKRLGLDVSLYQDLKINKSRIRLTEW